MAVGMKKITTQILNETIKTNFESLKDGTGKPLKQNDGEESNSLLDKALDGLDSIKEIMGSVGNVISGLVKTAMNIVNKILSAVKSVMDTAMGFINKIVSAVAGVVKKAIAAIMNIVRIPMQWLGNIFKKALGFIKELLGPIGASLFSKSSIRRLGSSLGLGHDIAGLIGTGTLMGLLFGKTHDKNTLGRLLKNLKKDYDPFSLAKAYKSGLYKHKDVPSWYYDYYRDIGDGLSDDRRREHRALFRDAGLDRRIPYKQADLGLAFQEYTFRGFDKSSGRDLAYLAKDEKIRSLLNTNRVFDGNKTYSSLVEEANNRRTLSDRERLTNIKYGSGWSDNRVDEREPLQDYMSRTSMANELQRYNVWDGGLRFRWYTLKRKRYHGSQLLGFTSVFTEYDPTVKADLSYPNEIDQIGSMVGVNNYKLEDKIAFADFEGYKNKTSIENTDHPTLKGKIAEQSDITHILEAVKI